VKLFQELEKIDMRPELFESYTARELWADPHISEKMLSFHLDGSVCAASRSNAFISESVKWIVDSLSISEGTRIGDFGCGPGLYSLKLAAKGASVTGIDFSERSITYAQDRARSEGLSIEFIHQDYLKFRTEKLFDLVILIMCDYCSLSPSQRRNLLEVFSDSLKPGGIVLLDVYSLIAYEHEQEKVMYEKNMHDGFWAACDYHAFHSRFKYESESVVLDKYTIVESDRTRTIYNWKQCFSPESLMEELQASSFSVEEIYSDVCGTPFDYQSKEFAVLARKL